MSVMPMLHFRHMIIQVTPKTLSWFASSWESNISSLPSFDQGAFRQPFRLNNFKSVTSRPQWIVLVAAASFATSLIHYIL